MSGIVEFLRARLDEDEAIAEACRSDFGPYGPHGAVAWELHDNGNVWWPDTNSMVATGQWGDLEDAVGKHITRHDPARVLREVAAMRHILDAISPPDPHEPGGCPDCDVIYALATIYIDHPDYRQEWTP